MFDGARLPITHRSSIRVSRENCDRILSFLWPGDVILKWTDGGVIANVIKAAQEHYAYPPLSHEITHVSMYTGHNEVFHATFSIKGGKGSSTRLQSFLEYYMGEQISIARPYYGTAKSASIRTRLVLECKQLVGKPYNWSILAEGTLVGSYLANLGPKFGVVKPAMIDALSDGHICSTALFEVFEAVSGSSSPVNPRGICPTGPYIMPADFHVSPDLVPISIK